MVSGGSCFSQCIHIPKGQAHIASRCHLISQSACLVSCAFDLGVIKRTLHSKHKINSIGKGSWGGLRRLLRSLFTFALAMGEIVNGISANCMRNKTKFYL